MRNYEAEGQKGRTTVNFFQGILNGEGKGEKSKPRTRASQGTVREETGKALAREHGLPPKVFRCADGDES